MKVLFGCGVEERTFEVGEKVLLFLPIRKCPLQAKHKGSFKTLRRVGKVNYVISTPGQGKSKTLVRQFVKEILQRRGTGSVQFYCS